MSWNWNHQQHQPPWRPTWQHGQNATRPPALLATPPAPIDWAARAREWASHAQHPNPVPRGPPTACPIRTSVPPPPPPPMIPSSMRSDETHSTQIHNLPQTPNNQMPGANNSMSKPWEWNRNWSERPNQPPPPVPPVPPVLSVAPPDPSVAPPIWNTAVRPPIQRDGPSVDYNRPPPPPGVESWNPDFKDVVTNVRPPHPHAPVFDYNHGQNRSHTDMHISNHAKEETKNHQTHSFHHSTPRHLAQKHHEQSPQHDRQHAAINLDNSTNVGTSFHGFSQGQSNHNQLNLSPHSYTNRHAEISNSAEENETSSEGTATTTVASAAQKRRQLPAWIREQLEKIKAKEIVQKVKHDVSEEKSLEDTDDDSSERASNYQNGMKEVGETTTRKSTLDTEKQEKVKDSPVARPFEKTAVSEHSQSSTPKDNSSHSPAPMTKEEREFGTLRICSDILLGVTSLMIEEVSEEVIDKAKRRREAKKARESTNSGTKLPTLGLGLIAYDVESSESGSDVGGTRTGVPEITDEEESEDELRKQIALKRLRFEQKNKELEDEHREEPRRRHHSSSKRSIGEPEDGRGDRRSPSRGNDTSRGAGHEARDDDISESRQRKNRTRHRHRNKDKDRHSDDSSDRVSRDARLKRRSETSAKHSRRHDRRSSVSESSTDSHRHRRHRARKSDARNTSVSSSRRRHGRRYRQDDSSPSSRHERSRRDVSPSYSSSSGGRHRQRDRRRHRKRDEEYHRSRRSSSTEVSSRKRKLDDSKSRPSKVSSKGETSGKPSREKKKKSKEKKRRKASSGNSADDDDKETYSGKQ